MIVPVRAFGRPALQKLLQGHPFVAIESFAEEEINRIEFDSGRPRKAYQGNSGVEQYGLTELMDNNPLVCAGEASVTGAAATLVMVALGPLAKAGLIMELPAIALNFGPATDEIDAALATEGWLGGTATATSDGEPEALVAECICMIRLPGNAEDIQSLYDECFARSFFVREGQGPTENQAHASYSISVEAHGDSTALARVVSASNRHAKSGAGGLVHMFNVMCGFEESLGVAV